MQVIEIHEAAGAFPMLTEPELNDLATNIKQNGQQVPIVLYGGKILDGRNRFKACQIAGVEPLTENRDDIEDPFMWVWSLNAERRHLQSQEQKALIWKKLHGMSSAMIEARERIESDRRARISEAATAGLVGRASQTLDVAQTVQHLNHGPRKAVTREYEAQAAGVNRGAIQRADTLLKSAPDLADKVASGETRFSDAAREASRRQVIEKLESTSARETKAASGIYDVVVIDPPWPMQKIERDVAPNQVAFDYPVMTEEELQRLKIPMADDCHVWLWTTHKFLPMAFRLLDQWGMKYVCSFVWHKNGGFQPFGLPQYNCEFAIYARKGTPVFIDTKEFNVCFNAPRGKHSEKPEEFYEVVRRVTAGRRLDMFNRRAIEGFDGWGNESGIYNRPKMV
jgi:N6-adenosine-specific RNA methylase IME4